MTELEYQFWITKRNFILNDEKKTVLNRYYDESSDQPRIEAYVKDIELMMKNKNTNLYAYLRSAAESGWDFSSRRIENEKDLSNLIATDILTANLNCLLYHLGLTLGKYEEAKRRRCAIQKYFWSNEKKFFFDFNFKKNQLTDRFTLAAFFHYG